MTEHSLSRNEREILAALQSDARQTNRSLAQTVGLAASTTLDRTRDLERRGVISGYHADVDLRSLGRRLQAFVSVRVSPKSEAVVDRILERLWSLPETVAVFLVSGGDDLLIQVAVRDTDHLRDVVLAEIASLDGVVDETTSLIFEHRRKTVITPL
ncbi:MAG: Lrp/AsnC family transcriptional regulator [Acidimicrobiales bacterium]|jgi:DNA-binding Lrp family transcriptional regulator|nr:Lrp/AsnC family transcriptional regulator [Acidimicrobiales bacterium]